MRRGPLALVSSLAVALAACGEAPRARHVVLVTVDTLRADRLGAYGYDAARTPAFDALAAKSLLFERAYAHSGATLPSIATLMSGRLPASHGLISNGKRLDASVRTLAQVLRAAGFTTGAFIGSWVMRRATGMDRGFVRYTDDFRGAERNREIPENSAAVLTDRALVWLADREPSERLFLWVHYQEPHGPYTPRDFEAPDPPADEPELPKSPSQSGRGAIPAYQWLGHGHLSEYEARYDAEIAEMDRHLGRLLAGLRRRGLLDEAALVFTADHGEAFGEDGLYCAHSEGLGRALQHVPLLLRAPGVEPDVRPDRVGLIDVPATLLELAGVEGLAGRSLLEDAGDRRIVAQVASLEGGINSWRAVREGPYELVERQPDPERLAVHSVLRGGDGAEPERRAALRALLETSAPWPPIYGPLEDLDPSERAGLRALGYLD